MICDVCGGDVEVRGECRTAGVEVLTARAFYAHVGTQGFRGETPTGVPFHGAVVDGRHYPPEDDVA